MLWTSHPCADAYGWARLTSQLSCLSLSRLRILSRFFSCAVSFRGSEPTGSGSEPKEPVVLF